jgi:hypothetical protein
LAVKPIRAILFARAILIALLPYVTKEKVGLLIIFLKISSP